MVSPSNAIAASDNPGKTMFPNLARPHGAKPEDFPEVDEQLRIEAEAAGLTVQSFKFQLGDGEVPTCLFFSSHKWVFNRAWYYWRAKGPGVPPADAAEFDQEWGKQVRASGDCACRGVEFWYEGFAASDYHIDTQEGLNAFVQMLARIHKPRPDEREENASRVDSPKRDMR